MTEPEDLLEGLVVRSQSGFYTVRVGERTLVCSLPGRFKQGRRTEKSPLVIGDHVVVRPGQDQEGAIERNLTRRNELARAAAGGGDLKHVLAANLDLVILAFALHEPDLNTPRLDRFLLAAEQAEIPPVIVITKLDLGNVDDAERILHPYRDIGYPVLLTSARTGLGMEAIRETLAGKISAIIGSSGVGKSSLLNALQPGLAFRFAEISSRHGEGPPHHHRSRPLAAGFRRLPGRYARSPRISPLGSGSGGGAAALPRNAPLSGCLPVCPLYPSA